MTDIQTETSELGETSARWLSDAPTEHGVPPVVTTPPADPISAGIIAVVAEWPGVHASLTATRATMATQLAAANYGTATSLSATDGDNAVVITKSAGG
jgi:hypothetical protein